MDIIVNADDLGASLEINDAVFALMVGKRVTSATMIANGPDIEAACQQAGHFSSCSFGAHLNVTEFRPMSGSRQLQAILDDEGEFAGEERIRQVSIGTELAEGIFSEFYAQIQRLNSLGVAVTHLDSHHHVHTIPRILPILKKVQKEFNLRKVGITRNIYAQPQMISRSLAMKKTIYNFFLRRYYQTITTQGFADFRTFFKCGTTKGVKFNTVEVMVHPGSLVYGYQGETQILRTPWEDTMGRPVRLISYKDLGG